MKHGPDKFIITQLFRYLSVQRACLRHYATSRKVVGSIVDEGIGFFNLPNSSSRTMALGLTQPLTEISTRNLPVGEGGAADA
jgi:hypothetical protein